eukprot:XP_001709070.1 Hypothetical protein GL50803_39056 [Giardia lamblia ATCC 50803]
MVFVYRFLDVFLRATTFGARQSKRFNLGGVVQGGFGSVSDEHPGMLNCRSRC